MDWKSLELTIALYVMLITHFFLGLGWVAYCCLHSILATQKAKVRLKILLGSSAKYYRLAYVVFSILGLVTLITWQYFTPTVTMFQSPGFKFIPAMILTLFGLALMFICLQKYFTSHAGPRELVMENQRPVLLRKGLHRFVRHPLYLSTFIFLWSIFLMFPYLSFLITNLIITVYTLIAIRFEERKLHNTFGEAYTEYAKDVPMIIPKILARRESAIGNRQSAIGNRKA